MSTRQHILVPVDFTEVSIDAVRAAKNLAFDSTDITLLHVYDPVWLKSSATLVLEPKEKGLPRCVAREVMTRLQTVRKMVLNGVQNVNLDLAVNTNPAKEIYRYARRHGSDLVIVGTHGRNGVSRFLRGSVAEDVVRRAPCPVLVVHEHGQSTMHSRPEQLPLANPAIV